ncbi:MAG: hypothetical protein LBJ80_02655 [Rickettsiales bacterium]|jgi:hypothetical protein|nr:hypothetical protein [Rickettsiales bacterium]MDR1261300.1 hypothetical protein [Rickettsiales bacterium]
MSSSTSEEKENPVVTLRTQADGFDFSKLRAGEDNAKANSGETMLLDFYRMSFVINKKSIDNTLTIALIKGAEQNGLEKSWDEHCKNEKTPDRKKTDQYKKKFEEFYNLGTEHTHLLPKEETGDYRPFAKEVFKEMFKYAKAEVPSDPILEELVTNCNQAGYEAGVHMELQGALVQHSFIIESPEKVISIDRISQNSVSVRSDVVLPIFFQKSDGKLGDRVCDLSSSLEFTLESQDGKDGVTYKNGKLSLTVPERLKDYNTGDKSLFDVIQDYFYKFCEKLGFFTEKVECGLSNPLEVNSCVTSQDVDPLVEHKPSVGD